MSVKTKASVSNAAYEPMVSDYNDKHDHVSDTNIQEKHIIHRINRFPVDHLKTFFEQEMNAREIDHNCTMADAVR